MSPPPHPFPVLDSPDHEPWSWPLPRFIGHHVVVPRSDSEQPCRVETLSGAPLDGEVELIDPVTRTLHFRLSQGGGALALSFSRFRRLTLTRALAAVPRSLGEPDLRLPAAEEERSYRLEPAHGGEPMTGTTLGHIENAHGLFLFTPVNEDRSVQRVFVPKGAWHDASFGPTAVDQAAEHWIANSGGLVEALRRQRGLRVMPLGESLLALGLLTRGQLSRALERQDHAQPLGEQLVSEGLISWADLQTALAHKMGLPIVDLTRFPIEAAAMQRLPPKRIGDLRALPLMLHEGALVVVVDRLSRLNRLHKMKALVQLEFLPVLASQKHILAAISQLAQRGLWPVGEVMPQRLFEATRPHTGF